MLESHRRLRALWLACCLGACAQPSVSDSADTAEPLQRGKAVGPKMSTHFVNPHGAEAVPTDAPVAKSAFTGITVRVDTNAAHESTVHVQNRGNSEAQVSATLQWVSGEQHKAFPAGLRADCAHESDTCITLVPGAELVPPPWRHTQDGKLCQCEPCEAVPDGDYRAAVRSCDGKAEAQSEVVHVAGTAQALK